MADSNDSSGAGQTLAPRPPDWRDGRTRRGDIEVLFEEVRECQDLLTAILISIVGEDKLLMRTIDGAIARANEKRRRRPDGEPLVCELVPSGLHSELASRWDILTLRELVHEVTREQVAALPGMGKKRMQKLDNALAEAGLEWVEGGKS